MAADSCVIVSFYDERPSAELVRLLRQLRQINAGAEFDLCVVVNSARGQELHLPADLASTQIFIRENAGFNIGAWNHGWKKKPGFSFYIFLQDECEIARENWLSRYRDLLSKGNVGLVGESLIFWRNWAVFKEKWPEAYVECVSIGSKRKIALGKSPTHLQTLALGATGRCLDAIGGFPVADGKVKAIATEVMLSRHCIDRGFGIAQSAWRPFEFITHSQWDSLRSDSTRIRWKISRALSLFAGP